MGRIKPLRSWKLQYLPASDLCMGNFNMSQTLSEEAERRSCIQPGPRRETL